MKNEIILYQTDGLPEHIEVRLEDETVWLTQAQMATLFEQAKQNISLHINKCFKEGELEKLATIKDSLTVQIELEKLAASGNQMLTNESGEIVKLFLYDSATNPANQPEDNTKLWKKYFDKLKVLSKWEV
ncbi:MAG: hypothetical protein IPM42_09205 [Saprospiraceae bacterium]|nr:hypothetical protein [Saprospiraceae bacterium]